jgi:hypothetical protein
LLAVLDENLDAATCYDEEGIARVALLEKHLVLSISALFQHVADLVEICVSDVLENLHPAEDVGEFRRHRDLL